MKTILCKMRPDPTDPARYVPYVVRGNHPRYPKGSILDWVALRRVVSYEGWRVVIRPRKVVQQKEMKVA